MSYNSGREVYGYLNQIRRCFTEYNGDYLSSLVSLYDDHVRIMKNCNQAEEVEFEKTCQEMFDPPFDEMIGAHLKCCYEYLRGNLSNACACQMVVVQSFQKGFQAQKEENWALPVLGTVVLDLRLLALKCDRVGTDGDRKEGDMLEKAADLIMSCFRICVSDSRTAVEHSKRWGTLLLVNQLFKIYFKINKLPLCKPLIRAIESSDIKAEFPISHLVTYKYFVGRKSMFDGEFKQGATCLSFAFEHCHISSTKNKRSILMYLIPIKMMLGQMPKQELLDKYKLSQFSGVAKALCQGNLKMFSASMQENQAFFIKAGIYLILEKLKTVAIRNLFKKIWLIIKSHQLNLKAFEDALAFNEEEDIDGDEVECITANLIDRGYIKGYISHQHQKLVVSKQLAFPPLSSVQH